MSSPRRPGAPGDAPSAAHFSLTVTLAQRLRRPPLRCGPSGAPAFPTVSEMLRAGRVARRAAGAFRRGD